MQLGESLLAMGAVVMFTVASLQLAALRLDGRARMWEAEFRTTAQALAQSYLEEAQSLAFDEAVVASGSAASLPEGLTAPASLGPEGSQGRLDFDDIDDFHGYTEQVRTARADFQVRMTATYLDSAALQATDQRSFVKWLTVSVSCPCYRDTLRVHYLYAVR
jgi:MSHA pilin protein MshD